MLYKFDLSKNSDYGMAQLDIINKKALLNGITQLSTTILGKAYKYITIYYNTDSCILTHAPSDYISTSNPIRLENLEGFLDKIVKTVVYKTGDWLVLNNTTDHSPEEIKEMRSDGTISFFGRENARCFSRDYRLATEDEIISYLLADAKKRYKPGMEIASAFKQGSILIHNKIGEIEKKAEPPYGYVIWNIDNNNRHHGWLYNEGQWAKIIEKREFMIGNHKVKRDKHFTYVGCFFTSDENWLKLAEVMDIFELKTVQHKDGTVATIDEIKSLTKI